jgi:hypothetical protein
VTGEGIVMTSRRALIGGGVLLAVTLIVPRAWGQSRKPAITVYRDPT